MENNEMTYSIEEANYIIKNYTPEGEHTLSDWILLLFYSDTNNTPLSTIRLMNEVFLMYHEEISKRVEKYGIDLSILFRKTESGVYSIDVENTVDNLVSINYLEDREEEEGFSNEDKISLSEKGIDFINNTHPEAHWFKELEKPTIEAKRKEWDRLEIKEIIAKVHSEYPYYCFFKNRQAELWFNKAKDLIKSSEKFEEDTLNRAIMYFNKALAINPDSQTAWYQKGNVLFKLTRYEEAVECYDKVLEMNPKSHHVWNNRGMSLAKLGKREDAIRSFEKAIQIDPEFETAQVNKNRLE